MLLATDAAWNYANPKSEDRRPFSERIPEEIEALDLGIRFERRQMPDGKDEEELWASFRMLLDALRVPAAREPHVVLDVTNGFRSQPFFAAGAVTFVNLIDEMPGTFRVVYGAFEAGEGQSGGTAPVWELTAFVDVVAWASRLQMFLRTGRAGEVAAEATELGRELRRTWASGDRLGDNPSVEALGKRMAEFGDALETVRTPALLLGDGKRPSAANALITSLRDAEVGVQEHLPPLHDVLKRVGEMVEPIAGSMERLNTNEGLRAMLDLARLYHKLGRYAEAAAVLREAHVTREGPDVAADPRHSGFAAARKLSDERWGAEHRQSALVQVRNDIEHAGFNGHARSGAKLKAELADLIEEFARALNLPAATQAAPDKSDETAGGS